MRRDVHRTALYELEALIGEYEVDSRRQRPAVEPVEELVGSAVLRRRMGNHAKPVGDRLEGLRFVVHAGFGPPPGTLVHKGTVGRVHESDDAVVDGAVQDR